MIGSRRMAYPRVEAFSFWIFMAGYLVILSALFFGGFPTGWTGYAPLQTQAAGGMDSYLVGFAVIGIGMILAGFNLACTIINYRAPGMTLEPGADLRLGRPGDHARCSRWRRRRSSWPACSGSWTAPPRPPSS